MKSIKYLLITALLFAGCNANSESAPMQSTVAKTPVSKSLPMTLDTIPFDGELAHKYLTELCEIGPRPSGSEGMKRQQEYLIQHFSQFCDAVEQQAFQFPYPGDNSRRVTGVNLIFRWKPERKERILLCAHYDTLPLPTENPERMQHLPFVGAEDNAGGVGILMVLAQSLSEILEKEQPRYGVDIVMLDAEEFMFRPSRQSLPNERFCWGSEFFGRKYASQKDTERGWAYEAGVLLDMVTHFDARFQKDMFSFQTRAIRQVQTEIWNTAKELKIREFDTRVGGFITDDHVYLYQFGKIPVVDIIDMNYAPWHTHEDTPDKCSPLMAAKVGWVVKEWIRKKK